MAQATVALVKELGGLNADEDYLLWRYSTPDELDAAIVRGLAVASAWIRRREPGLYTTSDADTLSLLAVGEAWLCLYLIVEALKSRKVFGTHWAVDQEDSSRFQQLIDVEYLQQAQFALGLDLTVIETPAAFARPTFTLGPSLDRLTDSTIAPADEVLQRVVDETNVAAEVLVVTP